MTSNRSKDKDVRARVRGGDVERGWLRDSPWGPVTRGGHPFIYSLQIRSDESRDYRDFLNLISFVSICTSKCNASRSLRRCHCRLR